LEVKLGKVGEEDFDNLLPLGGMVACWGPWRVRVRIGAIGRAEQSDAAGDVLERRSVVSVKGFDGAKDITRDQDDGLGQRLCRMKQVVDGFVVFGKNKSVGSQD
jgi:hypothetical protein